MDIIKIASVAKSATFIKRADTPGYQPGGNKRPTYQGRYTPVPGGVVKYQPKTIGYHNTAPAAVSKGKDIVDINAQGTAVSNQNNITQVRNEAAAKATRNTAKQQNASLPRGNVSWNPYKGANNETDRNMGIQLGRVVDNAAASARRNAANNYNDEQMQANPEWGWIERLTYNHATGGNNMAYVTSQNPDQKKLDGANKEIMVDMRTPEQLKNVARGAFLPAVWAGVKGAFTRGVTAEEAFDQRLQEELAKAGDKYRTKVQQFGVNVSEDDKPGTMGNEPNAIFTDINGNERYGYIPKKHYRDENGYINPTFNDYNHDVTTRGDGILQYLGVGASPNARNTDLQAKSHTLLNGIAEMRSDPNMFNQSTGWSQQAIDSVVRNPDFQSIYQAAVAMPKNRSLDARRLAQLFLMNGASLLWTK